MSSVTSCHNCKAPLPRDRRRRYCDDCREEQPLVDLPRPVVVDITKAQRATHCRCAHPLLYEDDGDIRCASCGRAPHSLRAAA